MAKFKMHKECWAQLEYAHDGATYVICVCGEYVKVTFRAKEGERDAEDNQAGSV